jgi:hypothetical protein
MKPTILPGVGGSLLPARFLADGLWKVHATNDAIDATGLARGRTHFERWWRRLMDTCGPATGIRAVADLVATPLAGMLGFRVRETTFDGPRAALTLNARHGGGSPVAMLVLPWSSRPSVAWRDLVGHARVLGASWGFVLAPPYLSLIDLRAQAVRRSIDFMLPEAFDGPSFPAFWALTNARSFAPDPKGGRPSTAQIDRIVAASTAFRDGVRRDLQVGVIQALTALVTVVDGRPASRFDEALTIVYRVLFLLFAESRDLVPRRHPVYGAGYTIGSLVLQALDAREGAIDGPARGLWDGLGAMTRLSRIGCDTGDLIVRPFNGRLFARHAAPSVEPDRAPTRVTRSSATKDEALGAALVALATRSATGGRETIDYADLGVEQLGAVYERVLDIDPTNQAGWQPRRRPGRHSDLRKTSGAFYTPQALCDFVVRRTLTPLVDGATSDDILRLRVVDPAMGSGAFLVSACRFLASAYEQALVEEGRVAPVEFGESERADVRRLVAERCLFGIDSNPIAVQLARLSLWLATLAHGKPLTFLDHRLRAGNSLIGTSPDRLRRVPGHTHRAARQAALPLVDLAALEAPMREVVRPLAALATRRDETVDDVRAKEAIWTSLSGKRSPLRAWQAAADLWCARWFSRDPASAAETRAAIDGVLSGDPTLGTAHLARRLADAADTSIAHGFFHWPIEFPDVFHDAFGAARDRPGFDAVIGNPPWEMLRRDSAGKEPPGRLVEFIRRSGLYPSSDRGHVNLYQPFVERALTLARPGGRVGLVLPWGFAVDEGATTLRARLFDTSRVDVILGLDNAAGLFPIHRGLRFMAVIADMGDRTVEGRGRFGVSTAEELARLPGGDAEPGDRPWPIRFSTDGATGAGGRARRIPDARRPGDLEVAERLARDYPRLGSVTGWAVRFGRELNATEDKQAFGRSGLPVIDGKHLAPFRVSVPDGGTRIAPAAARSLLPDGRYLRDRLAYRDVSGVANRVSLIAAVVPAGVVTTHTLFCLRTRLSLDEQHFLCACFNSYVVNAVVRLLMGNHVTTALVEDLPIPVWRGSALDRRISRMGRRLARPRRSPDIEARLQAAVARRFGLDAATFAALVGGFPLVPASDRQRAVDALRARGRDVAV